MCWHYHQKTALLLTIIRGFVDIFRVMTEEMNAKWLPYCLSYLIVDKNVLISLEEKTRRFFVKEEEKKRMTNTRSNCIIIPVRSLFVSQERTSPSKKKKNEMSSIVVNNGMWMPVNNENYIELFSKDKWKTHIENIFKINWVDSCAIINAYVFAAK